jgi:hypothetical protein
MEEEEHELTRIEKIEHEHKLVQRKFHKRQVLIVSLDTKTNNNKEMNLKREAILH